MSAFKRFFFLALLFALAAPAPLWAQDIFIRPSTGGDKAKVDYGVKAVPQVQPAPTPVTPPVQQPAPQPTTQSIPRPTQQPTYAPPRNDMGIQNTANGQASVVKIPSYPAPSSGKGPASLHVNFKGSLIGKSDKANLSRVLGYSEQEIQSNCFFQYAVLVHQSGTAAFVSTGSASSMQYNFTPPLEKAAIIPTVACRKLHPPVSGVAVEQGGYYVDTLPPVECTPGSKGMNSVTLNFSYTGDGSGQCEFP